MRSDEEELMDLEKVLRMSPPKAPPTSSTITSIKSRGDSKVSDGDSQFIEVTQVVEVSSV